MGGTKVEGCFEVVDARRRVDGRARGRREERRVGLLARPLQGRVRYERCEELIVPDSEGYDSESKDRK